MVMMGMEKRNEEMQERNGIKRHKQNGDAIAKNSTAFLSNECHRNCINRIKRTVYPNFNVMFAIVNTPNRPRRHPPGNGRVVSIVISAGRRDEAIRDHIRQRVNPTHKRRRFSVDALDLRRFSSYPYTL